MYGIRQTRTPDGSRVQQDWQAVPPEGSGLKHCSHPSASCARRFDTIEAATAWRDENLPMHGDFHCWTVEPLPEGYKRCSCCGSDAGRWKQHHNMDTGFGICMKCIERIRSFSPEHRERVALTDADILRCYGVEGVNFGHPKKAEGTK